MAFQPPSYRPVSESRGMMRHMTEIVMKAQLTLTIDDMDAARAVAKSALVQWTDDAMLAGEDVAPDETGRTVDERLDALVQQDSVVAYGLILGVIRSGGSLVLPMAGTNIKRLTIGLDAPG